MTTVNTCVFCDIAAGNIRSEKIFENEHYFAFLDRNPIRPGHTLVIPKKHAEYIFDMSNADYESLLLISKKIANLLQEKLNPKRVGLVVEGFGVAHVHVHLIPINNPHELNPLLVEAATAEELKMMKKIITENK